MSEIEASWRDEAACIDAYKRPKNPFQASFSERLSSREKRLAAAKAICATCPVFNECLNYISEHEEVGVWAGMDEDERYELGMPVHADDLTAIKRRADAKQKLEKRDVA